MARETAEGAGAPPERDEQRVRAPRRVRFAPALTVIGLALAVFAWFALLAQPDLLRLYTIFLTPPIAGLLLLAWWLLGAAPARDKLAVVGAACCAAGLLWVYSEAIVRPFALLWGLPATGAVAISAGFAFRRAARRRVAVWGAAALALVPWLLVRSDGQIGDGMISFAPRWRVPDSRLAVGRPQPTSSAPASAAATLPAAQPGDWPGFRGPRRDGIVRAGGDALVEGFARLTPRWRQPIGAGWSSFAVIGSTAFTQEQRGESECVVAYELEHGGQRWLHADGGRFDELSGGPGPRATPTFADGRIVAVGPTGLITCLDAAGGRLLWQHRSYHEQIKPPSWGFAGSPLVVEGLVIVGLCGKGGIRLAAHAFDDGAPVWTARGGDSGYSSPQLATLDGVPQVLYLDGAALTGHEIATGRELWRLDWQTEQPKVAQPAVVDGNSVVIGMAYGVGLRRLDIRRAPDGVWQVRETWASNRLKPKFNDFVCHDGYAYGLDESRLACIDLRTGERVWKGERYGYGQVLLAPPLLLVVGESGTVVGLTASPAPPRELARIEALSGKTWNHPVLTPAGLLVRNAQEMALYR